MRVQGIQKDDWTMYDFRCTYRMSWESVIFVCRAIYNYLDGAEVLLASGIGTDFEPVKIENVADLCSLEEGSAIRIRGLNKIYDNVPFQFTAFNQTDVVQMHVPTDYVNSLKRSETELLNEEEKLHTFDKFMDSVEVNASIFQAEYQTAKEVMNGLSQAMIMKENFTEERIYRNEKADNYGLNLSIICRRVVENWKEIES